MLESIFLVRSSRVSWEVPKNTTQFDRDYEKDIFEWRPASLNSSIIGVLSRSDITEKILPSILISKCSRDYENPKLQGPSSIT